MGVPERGSTNVHDVIQGVTKNSLIDSAFVSFRELDALFDQAPIAMAFHDRELCVRRTNAAFRRMTGLPDEAIIGRRPSEVQDGMDAALAERILVDQVMTTGVPVTDVPLRPTPSGGHRVFSWSAYRVMEN